MWAIKANSAEGVARAVLMFGLNRSCKDCYVEFAVCTLSPLHIAESRQIWEKQSRVR